MARGRTCRQAHIVEALITKVVCAQAKPSLRTRARRLPGPPTALAHGPQSTIKKALTLLRIALNHAVHEDLNPPNSAIGVRIMVARIARSAGPRATHRLANL